MKTIVPSLWFNDNIEEALEFYTSVFPDSRIGDVMRMPDGTVVTADFELGGQTFNAINGAETRFPFSEAVSFVVPCESEEEADRYWDILTADGGEESQCGWLKDKFGLSWQIVPTEFVELAKSPDGEAVGRMMAAMMPMKKLDMPALRAAFAG